jgi:hypothetical protein
MPVPSPDEKREGKIKFILIWFLLGNAFLDLFNLFKNQILILKTIFTS